MCRRPSCLCGPVALQIVINFFVCTSLFTRIPLRWPRALEQLFRVQTVAGSVLEVYSLDCSIDDGVSKALSRSLGWFVAFFVTTCLPGVLVGTRTFPTDTLPPIALLVACCTFMP